MKLPDRQVLDERRPHFRGDDKQPVRLAVVGSELGKELVVGDSGRRRELGLGADFSPDFSAICVAEAMPLRFSVTSR